MKKSRFRLLFFAMSISLVGIIIVQLYWITTSFKKNEEEFKYHVQQVLGNISNTLKENELIAFYKQYNKIIDSTGSVPKEEDLKEIYFYERNKKTNETIIYSSTLVAENYGITSSFFDKNANSVPIEKVISKRKTEIYSGNTIQDYSFQIKDKPDTTIERSGALSALDKANFEVVFKDIVSLRPLQERINNESLQKLLQEELKKYGVKTPFEFGIYSNGLATKIKSEKFKYNKESTYGIPVFQDNDGISKYQLLVAFPHKDSFVFSSLIGITALSLLFTVVIILTYTTTVSQLYKQKQISEIKTDFINNMTHEFKTPIATINLALDAIKNPKIIDDKDKVQRYLQMIKEENKRMHAQVENVLRISKLERNELNIEKEPRDVSEIIQDAIDHVSLIIEDRMGSISAHLNANRNTILLNEVHFTNVLVNILDNAIKYSPDVPKINIFTENFRDFIIIKIQDHGSGMSKAAQKKVFEKFYREHTGDVHNVKGHGLGLAYVKQIVEDHNGEIYVESEKGKGSTFSIKLPLIN